MKGDVLEVTVHKSAKQFGFSFGTGCQMTSALPHLFSPLCPIHTTLGIPNGEKFYSEAEPPPRIPRIFQDFAVFVWFDSRGY